MTSRWTDIALTALGVCVPRYRLSGEKLAQTWGGPARRGERSVANYDEDALTMAATAAATALEGEPGGVEAVFFASCTAPYHEKLHASVLATVLRFERGVRVADFGASSRAAATALRAAVDAICGGSQQRVLVVLSDCHAAAPGGEAEGTAGDGAVALILGRPSSAAPLAWLLGAHGVTEDFPDQWRRESVPYPESADLRFVQTLGYERLGAETIRALLAGSSVPLDAVAHFAIAAPDERSCRGIERAAGIPSERCAGHRVLASVGDTGVAASGLALAAALEVAQAGALIVSVCFGGGAEALLWRADTGAASLRGVRPLSRELHWKRAIEHYGRYLQGRALLGARAAAPFSSPALLWRDQRDNLGLIARRCRRCGAVEFPCNRVCGRCRAKDEVEDFPLARRGRVFTFTHDYLVPTPNPPTTMAIADLDGGGRFYGQVTDCPAAAVHIGMPMELVLRRLHEGGGMYNYFWKLRPLPPLDA